MPPAGIALRCQTGISVRPLDDEWRRPGQRHERQHLGCFIPLNCGAGDDAAWDRVPLVLDPGEEKRRDLASTIVELTGDTWRVGRKGPSPLRRLKIGARVNGEDEAKLASHEKSTRPGV